MKINETIRERRLAKNMTQEQMAAALGVTAPAVNKWEKGDVLPGYSPSSPFGQAFGDRSQYLVFVSTGDECAGDRAVSGAAGKNPEGGGLGEGL